MDTQLEQEVPKWYRWYLLVLVGLTPALAVAAPTMCMPVLFPEIAADLNLTLVEIGVIWGMGALPSIVTSLGGGLLGDRFGPKRLLIGGSLLVGVVGITRGFAWDYYSLMFTVFLLGMLTPALMMNVIKTAGLWFSGKQLSLATGAISIGGVSPGSPTRPAGIQPPP